MSTDPTAAEAGLPAENPFAAASDLPYGLPPFDRIAEEHYAPAFEAGMAEQRREVEAVAADPAEPTFGNTLEALERSGELLTRVAAVAAAAHRRPVDPLADVAAAQRGEHRLLGGQHEGDEPAVEVAARSRLPGRGDPLG